MTGKYYVENYSDDTMLLIQYLDEKNKKEIPLGEIFSDTGLDRIKSFRETDEPISVIIEDGFEADMTYAIDIIIYLAALLLECKQNGEIRLSDFDDSYDSVFRITATQAEMDLIGEVLLDFEQNPYSYDMSDMMSEEEIQIMAADCGNIRKELYE